MKKEVAIAIMIGLILGLVVTFGIYTARKAASPAVEKSAELLASAKPGERGSSSNLNSSLVISSPEDGLITSAKEVQVSGTTDPNAFVFVFFDDQYKMEKADGTGNFSTKISTKPGPMVITLKTLDNQGNEAEDERAIFVGNPDESSAPAPSPSVSPSPSPKATTKPPVRKTSTSSAQPQ